MSRNLIGWVRPKRDLEMLLSFHSDTKDSLALNSLLGIFKQLLQTIYYLKQKLDERQQADWFHRKADTIPFRCLREHSIKPPT